MDVLWNIGRNLKAGFGEIISVATNKHIEEKIKEKLKGRNLKQVKTTSVLGFDITQLF